MQQELIINGYSIIGNIDFEISINESTKKELKTVKYIGEIIGEKEFNNYSNAIAQHEINVKIPNKNIEFVAQKNGYSSSYTDKINKQDIIYKVQINLVEIDKTQPQNTGFEIFGNMAHSICMNWARTRALSELLIEKGLFTFEEYESKIRNVYDRDNEEFRKTLLHGLLENTKDDKEK